MGMFSGRSSASSVERQLRRVSAELIKLRSELLLIAEQQEHLDDEASDESLRVLGAEPGVGFDHRQAQSHADAMARHRAHVVGQIADLEARQDRLLDQLTAR